MRHPDVDKNIIFQDFGFRELVSIVPEQNKRRFYRIEVSAGLWCPIIIRSWGRIGSSAREKRAFQDNMDAALACANKLLAKKIKRGYSVCA